MANYYGTARTNYVRVKDVAALTAALELFDVKVVERDGMVALLDDNGDGAGWPMSGYDEDTDTDVDFDLVALVAPHLCDGEVMIAMEAGAEKYRYIVGVAVAFNNKHQTREVSLNDIYGLAAELLADNVNATITEVSG